MRSRLKSILWVAFIIALLILLGLFFLVYSQNQSSRSVCCLWGVDGRGVAFFRIIKPY